MGAEPHKALIVAQDARDVVRRKTRLGPDVGEFWALRLRINAMCSELQYAKEGILGKLHSDLLGAIRKTQSGPLRMACIDNFF